MVRQNLLNVTLLLGLVAVGIHYLNQMPPRPAYARLAVMAEPPLCASLAAGHGFAGR